MLYLFDILNLMFLIVASLFVGYIFIFSLSSCFPLKKQFANRADNRYNSFLIMVPAYKADEIIEETVEYLLKQIYPQDMYVVLIISDSMLEETNQSLRKSGCDVLEVHLENSTKAQSLREGINYVSEKYSDFDYILILDADNLIHSQFLDNLKFIDASYVKAIQTHRKARNMDTDIAFLDAMSEEINNSIYRRGHVNCGLPSALIGSGMIFSYEWFNSAAQKLSTVGEDKELELLLIQDQIFVQYDEESVVLDEKVRMSSNFFNQRRRWLGAQIEVFGIGLKYVPEALRNHNIAYFDKLFQWLIPPRIILCGTILLWTIILLLTSSACLYLWILLNIVLFVSLIIAVPRIFFCKRMLLSMLKIPYLFILMLLNVLRLRGATRHFIHTKRNS